MKISGTFKEQPLSLAHVLFQKVYSIKLRFLFNTFIDGFEPNRLPSEKRWKPSVSRPASITTLCKRPQKVLRSSSSVLTQGKSCKQTPYKMPPGTAKVQRQSAQGI